MLRLLAAISLVLVLSTIALAAPGLDARPYVPDPVEFELGTGPAGVAANRGYVATPVRTSKRFNLVGLAWSGTAEPEIAVRARLGDGRWGRWTPATGHHSVGTSEPVWIGEADQVQYRMSRKVPGLRLRFVNTTGTATTKQRLLTKLRRTTAAAAARVAPAFGAASKPRIHPRSEWGGEKCPSRGVGYGRVKAALVHHTVTANEYSRAQVPAAILAVCRFHRNSRGWNDIGYNFLIDRFGGIWEGRAGGVDEAVVGSQAQGYNAQTTGISNLGDFTERPQSDAAITALARLIRWKLGVHGVATYGKTTLVSAGGPTAQDPAGVSRRFNRISGHRDTGKTACPGLQLYRQLPELRQRVGEQLPTGATVAVEGALPQRVVYARDGVPIGGRFLTADGSPVEGATLELQSLSRTGWSTISTALSEYDGTFTTLAKLRARTVLRWKFAGDNTHRPYRGDGASVAVVPAIALSTSSESVQSAERFQLSGSIGPIKKTGLTLFAERKDERGVWRSAGRVKLTPSSGTFTVSRKYDKAGSYRFHVKFAGDQMNLAAMSPYVAVAVTDPVLPF